MGQKAPQQTYIEVGGGPASLPQDYHTVIELPSKYVKQIRVHVYATMSCIMNAYIVYAVKVRVGVLHYETAFHLFKLTELGFKIPSSVSQYRV